MSDPQHLHLSRRERQIMDVIYGMGRATAQDVSDKIPDPPGYSSVRTHLTILEKKGHLKHIKQGAKFVYLPTRSRQRAAQSALNRVLRTFFDGSVEKVMATLLNSNDTDVSDEELDRLTKLIQATKKNNS
jgi:BlaI family transcriptional regulator, penicillinase repressor